MYSLILPLTCFICTLQMVRGELCNGGQIEVGLSSRLRIRKTKLYGVYGKKES